MINQESNNVITLLEKHQAEVRALQDGEYLPAEGLQEKSKRLVKRYFNAGNSYLADLGQINYRKNWGVAHSRHQTVLNAMLEEHLWPQLNTDPVAKEQPPKVTNQRKRDFKKKIVFGSLFVIFSTGLWLFNEAVEWDWLSIHPKRIAIYLSAQLLLLSIFWCLYSANLKSKSMEWKALLLSVIILIISLV